MKDNYSKFLRIVYLFGDLLLLNLSFIVAFYLKFSILDTFSESPYFFLLVYFNLLWLVVAFFSDNYEVPRTTGYGEISRKILNSVFIHLIIITFIFLFLRVNYFSRYHLLFTYSFFGLSIVIWRISIVYLLRVYRSLGYSYKNVVIVGYGVIGKDLMNYFNQNTEFGYHFKGFFDDKNQGKNIKGTLADLEKFVLENSIDEIYCIQPYLTKKYIRQVINFSDNNLIRIKVIPDLSFFAGNVFVVERHYDIPVLLRRDEPLNDRLNQVVKRVFDIAFASFVFVTLFSWLFPIIAFLIRLESKGPIFFIQKRTGINGEDFWCYKFRTMYVNSDSDTKQASRNDARITRIGKFLRKSNIDELPQFINVLIGDMSVVGPRPHMIKHTEYYSKIVNKYMVRHFVKPGITGLAQAKGFRGETQDLKSMVNRIRMDVFYVENWTFFFDIKIIFMTVFSMLKGDRNAF